MPASNLMTKATGVIDNDPQLYF